MNNKEKGINVLSLCDGMSCGQLALKREGVEVNKYFSSEIKKSAIKVTQENFPDTIQLGDIHNIDIKDLPKIDLVIGGTPCQNFSIARTSAGLKVTGLQGEKSVLFFQYLRTLKELQSINSDVKFLLENVRMNKNSKAQLDEFLGVKGQFVCSSLVSFQTRGRYYWTNITDNIQIKDKNINFQDFKQLESDIPKECLVNPTPSRLRMWNEGKGRTNLKACANITNAKKIGCVTRKQDRAPNSGLIKHGNFCRYLTRQEMELAQTLPIGYTELVSYNQAQDLIGDGWTIDVITEIFKHLKTN